jgi:hypothetical protein
MDSEVPYFQTGSNSVGKSQTVAAFQVSGDELAFKPLLDLIEVLNTQP